MAAFIFSTSLHRYLLVLPVLFALAAESVEATVFTVGATGGAACSLGAAITAAILDEQTGSCPAGSEEDTIELTGDIVLTKALPTIMSNCRDYPDPCIQARIIINGHGHSIARSTHPNTPEFDLLSIRGLCGEGYYGEPRVALNDVTLEHGQTGISVTHGGDSCPPSVILTNSRVSDNIGDGILAKHSSVSLTNSVIADNGGHGINGYAADIDVTDSTIAHNANRGILALGGNWAESEGALSVTRSTLVGNTGGGIELTRLRATLVNSTISGNGNASVIGGGIYQTPSDNERLAHLTLADTTVSYHVAEIGGGFYHDAKKMVWQDANGKWDGDQTTLINSIIANNTGRDCVSSNTAPLITFVGRNLIRDGGCYDWSDSASSPPLIGDPWLGPLQDNGGPTPTHALLEGSPALDRIIFIYDVDGNPLGCEGTTDGIIAGVVTDQRGIKRPQPSDGFCDIGAFEFAHPPSDQDDCKNGGYKKYGFETLEQCVQSVAAEKPGLDERSL